MGGVGGLQWAVWFQFRVHAAVVASLSERAFGRQNTDTDTDRHGPTRTGTDWKARNRHPPKEVIILSHNYPVEESFGSRLSTADQSPNHPQENNRHPRNRYPQKRKLSCHIIILSKNHLAVAYPPQITAQTTLKKIIVIPAIVIPKKENYPVT